MWESEVEKMKKQKIQKLEKSGPVISIVMFILRIFKKKPVIVGNIDLPNLAIYVSNHSGAAGPFTLSLYFPKLFVPWGAHPMTEGYPSRWKYLYHVFYRRKLKYGKCSAFLLATLFGLISKRLYVGMHVIPTYEDIRIRKTMEESFAHLVAGNSVLVFPEDSSEGYAEIIEKYQAGFVILAKSYLAKMKVDLPIIPVYLSKQKNIILIGNPEKVGPMLEKGMTREAIAEHFRERTNALVNEYRAKNS